ncbi:MAG TPA: hypothetical protein VLZ78_06145, partial [Terrimesophilobacter sp.]|nr:hypothetical protein [Terrimesophilobacter sp.]
MCASGWEVDIDGVPVPGAVVGWPVQTGEASEPLPNTDGDLPRAAKGSKRGKGPATKPKARRKAE